MGMCFDLLTSKPACDRPKSAQGFPSFASSAISLPSRVDEVLRQNHFHSAASQHSMVKSLKLHLPMAQYPHRPDTSDRPEYEVEQALAAQRRAESYRSRPPDHAFLSKPAYRPSDLAEFQAER